ncbi:MAG: hypothetical protein AAF892_14745 [Cyanobacteria bacterium P01_D01_bin.71]
MLEFLLQILMFSNTVSLEYFPKQGGETHSINCQRLNPNNQQWRCLFDTEYTTGEESVFTGEVTDYVESVTCLDDSYSRTIYIDSIPFQTQCPES